MCLFLLAMVLGALIVVGLLSYSAHYQEIHDLPGISDCEIDLSGFDAKENYWIPLNGR